MPITITPTAPGGVFTPGGSVHLASDFVGPLPSNSAWQIELFPSATSEDASWAGRVVAQVNPIDVAIMDPLTTTTTLPGSTTPVDGQDAKVVAQLLQGTTVIDTGSQTAGWKDSAGLGQVLATRPAVGAGLTPEQAQQLEELHANNTLNQLVDTVTLIPLTAGPTGDFVGAALTTPVFGVIIRLASVPIELAPQTPDQDYWVPTLAVVRIFRGQDLWLRAPIHTSSKIVYLGGEGIVAVLATAIANTWFLDMSLQVTWLPGVTGEVFLMRFP